VGLFLQKSATPFWTRIVRLAGRCRVIPTSARRPRHRGAAPRRTLFPLYLLFLLAWVPLIAAKEASAGINAEAELGYVDYQSRQSASSRQSGSAFTQRYSLLYTTMGPLSAGKAGYYNVSLGYEWAAINSSVHLADASADTSTSRNVGHILYSGELLYDPRELPIRLKAYSRDLNRPGFIKTIEAYALAGTEPVVDPALNTDVTGATSITSGAILTIGVKNSMTNGYYSVFKDLPRLFVDYWDSIQKDTDAATPTDIRNRKLAVVLNKKSNWLHYRSKNYDDNIKTTESFVEQKVIIGQIDEVLERHWVDLTNWIRISADGSFVKRSDASSQYSQETTVNLLGALTREKWQARANSSFTRAQGGANSFTSSSSTPVYVNGIWGSQADWQTRFSYAANKVVTNNATQSDQVDVYGSLLVNTFKRSSFTLSTMAAVESYERDQNKSLITNLRVESASTRRFSDTLSLVGSYDAKVIQSEGSVAGTAYIQALTGRATYRLTNRLNAELGQEFDLGSGPISNLGSTISSQPTSFDSNHSSITGSYVRSLSRLRLNWAVAERLQMLTTVSEDYVKQVNKPADVILTLAHKLSHRTANLTTTTELEYSKQTGVETRNRLTANASLDYIYNRHTTAAATMKYTRESAEGSLATSELNLEQRFNYNYFSYAGQGRKLVDFTQFFTYLQREGFDAETRKTLKLNAKYYPLRNLYLATNLTYSLIFRTVDETEFTGTGEVGVNYSKLQASLSYSYGRRDSATLDNRVDKRFAANLRKQF
jgi:hypothetical protein